MERTYWHKQTAAKPLFPELEWSRPENKSFAGKLLIIGGHEHSFAAPADAYGAAIKAGIGSVRVLLPNRLLRVVGKIFPEAEFTMSNPSGGFSQLALGDALNFGEWADGILLAGDTGRNSQTAILLEKLVAKYDGQITITKDAIDYFTAAPQTILHRPQTTVVLSFAQLQKLAMNANFTKAFTFDMDLIRLVDTLHEFTETFSLNIVTKHHDTIFVAASGQVSSTKLETEMKIWRVKTAASASVWWLQNPSKPFEALTTAANNGNHS